SPRGEGDRAGPPPGRPGGNGADEPAVGRLAHRTGRHGARADRKRDKTCPAFFAYKKERNSRLREGMEHSPSRGQQQRFAGLPAQPDPAGRDAPAAEGAAEAARSAGPSGGDRGGGGPLSRWF